MTRRFSIPVMLFVTMFVIAACGGTESGTPSTPATATLQGALVPTRIATNTPTPTDTVQPSDTPTERPSNTPTATATIRPSNTPTPSTPVVEPIRDIGVRLGPGSEYPIIATMSADSRLDVLGISEDGAWYQVLLPSGEIGWLVSSIAFVDAQGDLARLPIAAAPTETPTLTHTPSPTDSPTPTPTATETPPPASPTPDTVAIQQALSEAEIFADMERYEDAVDKFTEVIALDPNNFEALEGRGEAYVFLGEEMSALEDLNRALEIMPTSIDGRISRGLAYYNLGQVEDARIDFDYVIEQSPLESEAYYFRAFTYLDSGNPDEFDLGIRDLTRYIELEPTDPQGFYQRGMAFYYAENYQAARPDLERYVQIIGQGNADVEALDALADIEQQIGPPATPGGPIDVEAIRIEYGAVVSGEITNENPAVHYVFNAHAGQVIGISMNRDSGNLDPFLILSDPQGSELIRNDDDPENLGFNAYIREFTVPMDGPYTVSATRFTSGSQTDGTTGAFTLALELVREGGGSVPTPPPGENRLNYGAVVEGLINNDNWSAVYTFEGRAGEIIGIQMEATSGTLDTFIILIDPQGNELVRNDDDPENLGFDAYLRNFRLPVDGTYTIVATRFREQDGPSSGGFRLRLERAGDVNGNVGGIGTPPTGADPMAIGDTVTGSINDSQTSMLYSFEAEGGEQISISMNNTSGDLDTFVLLLAPDGRELARNDDVEDGDTNSHIDNIQLPGGGTYYVVATRYNTRFSGETSGDYTLTVSESSGPLNVQPAQIISYGQTVEGTFTEDIWQRTYTFYATQGDTIEIHVRRAEDIDSRIILTNNFGEEVYSSDDGFDGNNYLNPWLTLAVLPKGGHYTIVVESSVPGPYELEIILDEEGDPNVVYPEYGVLYTDFSGGLLETGDEIFYMLAGDWQDDNNVERLSSAYMTFQLPELNGQVASATLEIDWCVDFTNNDPDIVGQLGDINIIGNGYFTAETFTYARSPIDGAEVVSVITDCDLVDVTDFIAEAYANNATLVQFRAEISGVIENASIDGWLFTQPRLVIEKE